jgi:hypothetical protein
MIKQQAFVWKMAEQVRQVEVWNMVYLTVSLVFCG